MPGLTIRLNDGRRLVFEEDHPEVDTRSPSTDDTSLLKDAQIEGFEQISPRSGPDLLLWSRDDPGTVVVVEAKSVRAPTQIVALSDENVRQAIQQLMPERVGQVPQIQKELWSLDLGKRHLMISRVGTKGEVGNMRQLWLRNVSYYAPGDEDQPGFAAEDIDRMDTAYIERRVQDWRNRIDHLFNNITGWVGQIDQQLVCDRQTAVTMHEDLMRKFAVDPVDIPTLIISKRTQHLLNFKPYALWIIGANGRIDVFGPNVTGFLVDRAERFRPSNWHLFRLSENSRAFRSEGLHFDCEAFQSLLPTV